MEELVTNPTEAVAQASEIWSMIRDKVIEFWPKILLAVVVLRVWLRLIKLAVKIIDKSMQKTDASLRHFIESLVAVWLKIMLFIAVAGMFGVETTSFVAMLWAAWLAVWLALQWSLANFASGVLVLFFKPYQIGDLVELNSVLGNVKTISMFTTNIITPENKLVIIPNSLATSGNIVNYTTEGKIRVDVNVGVSYEADLSETKKVLENVLSKQDNILTEPKSAVLINELGDSSVNLIVRAFAKPEHYWDVFFGLTEKAKISLDENNIEIPYPHQVVHWHDKSPAKKDTK